jgi:hypothetical protein
VAWYWILLIALGSAVTLMWIGAALAIGWLGWRMFRDS